MKIIVLMTILPLAGCGFTSVQASLTPSAVVGQPPTVVVSYWSNKQQTWTANYNPETKAVALAVKSDTATGWGAEDVSKVVTAASSGAGEAAGVALKAYTGKP